MIIHCGLELRYTLGNNPSSSTSSGGVRCPNRRAKSRAVVCSGDSSDRLGEDMLLSSDSVDCDIVMSVVSQQFRVGESVLQTISNLSRDEASGWRLCLLGARPTVWIIVMPTTTSSWSEMPKQLRHIASGRVGRCPQ
jgi:hypothetical protein